MNPEPDDNSMLNPDLPALSSSDFESAYGESLAKALDLNTWRPGFELASLYDRLQQEVVDPVRREGEIHARIREIIFPLLKTRPSRPKDAGVWDVPPDKIQEVHANHLFNGGVEACDGTIAIHDTLPVTITQIGVSLVSYLGDQGTWGHRLFRRDLRASGINPVDETLDLLERRRARGGIDQPSKRDRLTELTRRGVMAYAERAVLLRRSEAVWRMGHGNPLAYELITGSGNRDLCLAGVDLLQQLVAYKKFVYVPSATGQRELLTIGGALLPLQYAIVDTLQHHVGDIAKGHYRGDQWGSVGERVKQFAGDCGDKVVVGVYRASKFSPAQVFYSHVDHAHQAALIAIADSVLQEHRGFPMLIDLADAVCRMMFGSDSFGRNIQLAYADAGEPFRYIGERSTRR